MKSQHKEYVALGVLIVLLIIVQVLLVSSTSYPAYDSYLGLRHVDHIIKEHTPMVYDSLSYQGRSHVSGIIFYYIVSLFALFIPVIILFKYASIVLFALALLVIYLLAKRLFPSRWIAFFVTFLAGFTPSLFSAHLNTLTTSSLFFLLYVLLLYFFVHLDKKHAITYFLITLIFATLISPLAIVLLVGFLFYFLLQRAEQLSFKKKEGELLFFASTFILWFHVLLYKKSFSLYGFDVVWQNIPRDLLAAYFQGLTLPLALSLIGIIPLLLGCYGMYYSLFEDRNRKLVFLTSLVFAFGLLTWAGFLQIQQGIIYTTLPLVLLSGYTLSQINTFLKKTTVQFLRPLFLITFIVLVIVFSLPVFFSSPMIQSSAPSDQDVQAAGVIASQSTDYTTVLALPKEGHFLSYETSRETLMDTAFLLAPHVEERYKDTKTIFLTQSQVRARELLSQYDVDFIYYSQDAQRQYGQQELFSQVPCIQQLFNKSIQVYHVTCDSNQ